MEKLHQEFSKVGIDLLSKDQNIGQILKNPVGFIYNNIQNTILEISSNYSVFEDFVNSKNKSLYKVSPSPVKVLEKNECIDKTSINKIRSFFKPGVETISNKVGVLGIKNFGLALTASAAAITLAVAFPIPSAAIAAVAAIKGRYVLKDLRNFTETLDKNIILNNISKLKEEFLSNKAQDSENIFRNA